jgi:hypothetical protein
VTAWCSMIHFIAPPSGDVAHSTKETVRTMSAIRTAVNRTSTYR